MVDLSVRIGALAFKNPVLTASGTFGYGREYDEFVDIAQLGGVVTKTITPDPRAGNPMPRIAETPAGMLNSIGLSNVGPDRYLSEKLPLLEGVDTVVICNVAGKSIDAYGRVTAHVQHHARIDGFEINVSCPNVEKGGLAFGTDPEVTRQVVRRVREETDKPVIVKLTPNVTDITLIAQAAVAGGANALSCINTVTGMGVDIRTRKPLLHRVVGGLSGPAIKPIALARVYEVARTVDVPVIGLGGIMTWQDVVEFMLAGATAIQIGTLNFVNPSGAIRIIGGLTSYCEQNGIPRLCEIVGALSAD